MRVEGEDYTGLTAGYATVLRRVTPWLGNLATLYEVRKSCCGEVAQISHKIINRLRSQSLMAAQAPLQARYVTMRCQTCAARAAAAISAARGGDRLGPAQPPTRRKEGPSAWLKAKRAQHEARARAAHAHAMQGSAHGCGGR